MHVVVQLLLEGVELRLQRCVSHFQTLLRGVQQVLYIMLMR